MRKKVNSLLCEALSVPAVSSVSEQCNQALKACRTRSLYFISRFWCGSSLSGYMCYTRVCTYTCAWGEYSPPALLCPHKQSSQGNSAEGPVLFLFPLGGGNFPPFSSQTAECVTLLFPLWSALSSSCCPPQYRF